MHGSQTRDNLRLTVRQRSLRQRAQGLRCFPFVLARRLVSKHRTTVEDSRTIFAHVVGIRKVFDPGCRRFRYLATAEAQA